MIEHKGGNNQEKVLCGDKIQAEILRVRGSQLWKEWKEECMRGHSRQEELDFLEDQLQGQVSG